MKQTEITINGKNYPIVFNLMTMSNFEDIVDKGFFEVNLNTTHNRMALVMAAVLAADKDTTLTVEELRGNDDWNAYLQITEAYTTLMKLADTFFPISEVAKGNEEPAKIEESEETEETESKN